jgi:hypothetical protein
MLALVMAGSALAEQWSRVELPGIGSEARIVGLGTTYFPDGRNGLWVSTEASALRRIDDQWQAWSLSAADQPAIRDVLMAPDSTGQTAWWIATDRGLWKSGDGRHWRVLSTDNSPLPDDDIRTLALHQSGQGPEIWIGSGQGLTIWRAGQWQQVLTRPEGFHGGPIRWLGRLQQGPNRAIWAFGPHGLSRHESGTWTRWAADCLRGHRLRAIQALPGPTGLILIVASDRGLFLLDVDDASSCSRFQPHGIREKSIQALVRDGFDQLYLLTGNRIERATASRGQQPLQHWTFFDHRDGLSNELVWTGDTALSDDGQLWAGSEQGLWNFQPDPHQGRGRPSPDLLIISLDHAQAYQPDQTIPTGQATMNLVVQATNLDREHALRHRFVLGEGDFHGAWTEGQELNIESIGFGLHALSLQITDDYGLIHGPYTFTVQRPWPIVWISAAVLVLLLGASWLLVRRFR